MRLRPIESRLAAVGLALLALAVGYVLLLHWWFVAPQLAIAGEMQDLRASEHRFSAIIAQRDALKARLARLQQGQARSSAFLPEDDPSAASAGLMQRAVDIVAAHAAEGPCSVTQKMPVPAQDDDSGPYRKVQVNISLRCGMRPLAAVLHDLEQGMPYLFVEAFTAYRNPVPGPGGTMQPLEVQFTLTGYVHQPAGGAS